MTRITVFVAIRSGRVFRVLDPNTRGSIAEGRPSEAQLPLHAWGGYRSVL